MAHGFAQLYMSFNIAHDAFVNVRGADTALSSDNVFRFCPQERRLRRHRYRPRSIRGMRMWLPHCRQVSGSTS